MLGPVIGVAIEAYVLAPIVPSGDGREATAGSIRQRPKLQSNWRSSLPPLKVRQGDRAVGLSEVLSIGDVRIVSSQELDRRGIALSQSDLIKNRVRLQIHELPFWPTAQRGRVAGATQVDRADRIRKDLLRAVLR